MGCWLSFPPSQFLFLAFWNCKFDIKTLGRRMRKHHMTVRVASIETWGTDAIIYGCIYTYIYMCVCILFTHKAHIVTDIHLEHNLEKIKQDRCRERTSHLEHHQISHLEHPVLYWITPCPAETSHLEHPVDIIINIVLKHIYVDCSSQLVECHWYHTLGKLHT